MAGGDTATPEAPSLDALTDRVAAMLAQRGVGAGSTVGGDGTETDLDALAEKIAQKLLARNAN